MSSLPVVKVGRTHMQVRLKLDALQQAFNQRSSERQISHAAHAVSAHTFELESALASGRPFQRELASLRQVASEDPLLQAILRSLPTHLAVQVCLSLDCLAPWGFCISTQLLA